MNKVTSFTSECSICLINIGAYGAAAERSVGVPCCKCKQLFHKQCLKAWYKRQIRTNQMKVSCPNCRNSHTIRTRCRYRNCFAYKFIQNNDGRRLLIWGRSPAARTILVEPVNTNNSAYYFIDSEAFMKLGFVLAFLLIVSLIFVYLF